MKKDLRWKVILVAAVIALAVFLAYPPGEKIHYGLDLQGGMHLVLQVMTDDAINYETDQSVLSLREELKKENITYTSVSKLEGQIGRFAIQEFDPEKERDIRDMLGRYFRDWDFAVRGGSFLLTLKSGSEFYLRNQSVQQALETIKNRVDELGLTEPTIQRQGLSGNRIIVELPGVEDPDRVKEILKTTALLEFRLVKAGPDMDRETLLAGYGGEVPEDMEVMQGDPGHTEAGWYLVSNVSEITGNDLRNARRSQDEWNKPAVSFTLHPDPGKRFERMTAENVGKPMCIVLDKRIIQVANIRERIPATSSTMIHGNFTMEEADTIAMMLRAGAMPASVKYLEDRTIGPSLGADSIRRGLTSILMALVLVMAFMVFYYRLAGLNAVLALTLNIVILMGALAYFGASLTLPGIAGIILTVGMAVDANVLVFERIREELAQGKSVLSSISSGFSRAFRTILDANVTTIIAAIFLFQFGTGPIRGFAVTIIIGISASMFTAIFVSRLIFDLTFSKRKKVEKLSI
jgi:preprotein translocase subunit SecD